MPKTLKEMVGRGFDSLTCLKSERRDGKYGGKNIKYKLTRRFGEIC